MLEIIRHSLGLCGESHPNLLFSFGAIVVGYNYCWCWLKSTFNKEHICNHGDETQL